MKYQGSKRLIAKNIWGAILEDLEYKEPARLIEPFIGGANFTTAVISMGYRGEIIAGDYDRDLNYMWSKVVDGWLPTLSEEPTLEEYNTMRDAGFSEDPLRGFSRSACGFGGSPWGAWIDNSKYLNYKIYPKDGKVRVQNLDFWKSSVNTVTKQSGLLCKASVKIVGGSYEEYEQYITEDSIVYCDPPYSQTRGYGNEFDSSLLWNWVERMSEKCPVYVSELSAPSQFEEIWSKELKHGSNHASKKIVSEKLFKLIS